ncbi:hypothetical protein TNCV_2755891 [Trichonephila clavipes]|nr:hypothetical protein TNCV_2755891 [Trichonephila clavipes]
MEVEIGGVAIYRPFGEFRRAKSYCHQYGAQGQRQASCHDDFRGSRSDYVRQAALETTTCCLNSSLFITVGKARITSGTRTLINPIQNFLGVNTRRRILSVKKKNRFGGNRLPNEVDTGAKMKQKCPVFELLNLKGEGRKPDNLGTLFAIFLFAENESNLMCSLTRRDSVVLGASVTHSKAEAKPSLLPAYR